MPAQPPRRRPRPRWRRRRRPAGPSCPGHVPVGGGGRGAPPHGARPREQVVDLLVGDVQAAEPVAWIRVHRRGVAPRPATTRASMIPRPTGQVCSPTGRGPRLRSRPGNAGAHGRLPRTRSVTPPRFGVVLASSGGTVSSGSGSAGSGGFRPPLPPAASSAPLVLARPIVGPVGDRRAEVGVLAEHDGRGHDHVQRRLELATQRRPDVGQGPLLRLAAARRRCRRAGPPRRARRPGRPA